MAQLWRAQVSSGAAIWSALNGAGSGGSAPTAPTPGTPAVTGSTTVTLPWTDNSGDETSFVVQIDSGSGYVNASGDTNPTAANVTSFAATGLPAATLCHWRVGAANASGTTYAVGADFTTDTPGGGGGGIPTMIDCGVGTAVASGLPCSISARITIACSVGAAVASGLPCGITAAVSYVSGAVLYIPVRMVSGLWSTSGVTASADLANLQPWLPARREPMGFVTIGGVRHPVEWNDTVYRFMQHVAEIKLGGVAGPTLPDVVTTVTDTQATAAAASASVTEIAQQTTANAEALAATVEVVKINALDRADQIPLVDMR